MRCLSLSESLLSDLEILMRILISLASFVNNVCGWRVRVGRGWRGVLWVRLCTWVPVLLHHHSRRSTTSNSWWVFSTYYLIIKTISGNYHSISFLRNTLLFLAQFVGFGLPLSASDSLGHQLVLVVVSSDEAVGVGVDEFISGLCEGRVERRGSRFAGSLLFGEGSKHFGEVHHCYFNIILHYTFPIQTKNKK